MSLRHVPLRGMGWSRNPTSFGFAAAKPGSQGQASAAIHLEAARNDVRLLSASTPSSLHLKSFIADCCFANVPGLLNFADTPENQLRGENQWVKKKT